jgi:hypothetical protein
MDPKNIYKMTTPDGQEMDFISYLMTTSSSLVAEIRLNPYCNKADGNAFQAILDFDHQEGMTSQNRENVIDFTQQLLDTNHELSPCGRELVKFWLNDYKFWFIEHPEFLTQENLTDLDKATHMFSEYDDVSIRDWHHGGNYTDIDTRVYNNCIAAGFDIEYAAIRSSNASRSFLLFDLMHCLHWWSMPLELI